MNTTTDKLILESEYLSRPNTVLIFKPNNYDKTIKYPLVYLLNGYSEDYLQWSQMTDLQKLADQYEMIIVTPDGFDSFYTNSVGNKKLQWESFFFQDLVPKIHELFSINNKNIFITGPSMGGYGALRLFFLYQDYFNTAASTSGALELDYNIFKEISQYVWKSNRLINDVEFAFGDPNEWPKNYIIEILERNKVEKPFLIDCGTEDMVFPFSINLKSLCESLKIPITFISQPGNHDENYWKNSIEQHFLYFKRQLINSTVI